MSNNNNQQQHKSKPQSQLLPPSPATKSKISNINVESTLRASLAKHASQKQSGGPKVKSAGQLWYEKLPINEQQQVIIGINALLYKGCMNAAKRTFDTVVRQEMANELHNGGGSVDQVSFVLCC